jgi:3-oxoacyl-[acyl-carrier protein] reductase
VAVITGGGRGIGAASAERLAAERASVVVSDMDAATTQETATKIADGGGRAIGVQCDVTKRESVEALVKAAVEEFGRLDILVCCAGIIRDNLIYKMTDTDWESVIDTHLKGTFFCAREAQKVMVPQKYGRMIFLSSTSALGNRGQTNYSTAKAGLQGMARTLAIELGRYGITVNAIAPGFVETAMTRQTAERMGMDFEQFKQGAAAQIPVQRIGQPEDIAAAVAFLTSEEAGFVSGQTLYVRGGP